MLIVDSQVHVWAPSTPERPWPPVTKPPHRDTPMGVQELLQRMDEAGVDRAVLISPSWEGVRNDLVLAAAAAHPHRFGVMGRLAFESPEAAGQFESLVEQPGVLGLRVTFHTPALQEALAAGRFEWLWRAAERRGLPLMIYAPHPVLPAIERVAAAHPGLRLMLCHLSIPIGTKGEAAFAGLDSLLRLARFPNVAAKASSLQAHSTLPYPHSDLQEPLRRTFDAFGAERVFWGTDLSKLKCTYRQAIDMYLDAPTLSDEEKAWFMGRGLCEWVGWDIGEASLA